MSTSLKECVLVLGATGRLGRKTVQQALQQGYEVIAGGRSQTHLEEALQEMTHHPNLKLEEVGLGSSDRLVAVFPKVDWVIDARNQRYDDWSHYPQMINDTLEALDKTPKPYTYVDNVYCYGRPLANPVSEDVPRQPISEKGRIRKEVEMRLLQAMSAGHTVMVARCPDFYGPGIAPFSSLESGILTWFGDLALPHQFVHVADAARALLALGHDPNAYGQVWHIPGSDPITGLNAYHLARSISRKPIRRRVIGPRTVWLLGLINSDARGFRETRYLWDTPMILDGSKWTKQYGEGWFRSHQTAFEEMLAKFATS